MIEAATQVGAKNVKLLVRGILDEELELSVLVKDFPKAKLSAAIWLIQEKLTLLLWWKPGDLLMPMESRSSFRLDRGWEPPKDWNHTIYISSANFHNGVTPKHFIFELDFDK